MGDVKTMTSTRPTLIRKPTEFLTKRKLEDLSDVDVAMLVLNGFLLQEVQGMLLSSKLYTSLGVIEKIVGKSQRAIRRQQAKSAQDIRLNAQQSAMAFHFAKVLEQATEIFGTQALAEVWLCRPSAIFSGKAPLQLLEISIGSNAVERYLAQIRHGVYI